MKIVDYESLHKQAIKDNTASTPTTESETANTNNSSNGVPESFRDGLAMNMFSTTPKNEPKIDETVDHEASHDSRLEQVILRRLNGVYGRTCDDFMDSYEAKANATAFSANALALGYAVDQTVWDWAHNQPVSRLKTVLEAMRTLRGADWDYEPMYPDFPQQVVEASDEELVVNALAHYFGDWVGVRITPDYTPSPRLGIAAGATPTKLTLVDASDLVDLTKRLLESGQVWSTQDKDDLKTLMSDSVISQLVGERLTIDSMESPIRENFVWASAQGGLLGAWGVNQYSLPTDVLRYAALVSGGDVSLSEPPRFHLSRAQRRRVAALLDRVIKKLVNDPYKSHYNDIADQFARNNSEWKHLAHAIHFKELHARGQLSDEVDVWLSHVMHGCLKTFNSRVEASLYDVQTDVHTFDDHTPALLNLLSSRPGEFARRLVEVLRRTMPSRHGLVIYAFSDVADKVSTPVLIQLWNLLQFPAGRTDGVPERRTVAVKTANGQSAVVIDNKIMKDVTKAEAESLIRVIEKALAGRKKEKLVELGPDADKYTVPMGTRSASAGGRQIGRGSRVKIDGWDPDSSVIRLFIHWHDIENTTYHDYGRVDLDLSAIYATEDFSQARQVSYTNLRDMGVTHSGDLTSAPNGAAEFIDVDAKTLLDHGYRYVITTVYSYTRQPFSVIPEASAGFMVRHSGESQDGKIFDARTVATKYDLALNSTNSTPFVFDLETGEMIWVDLAARSSGWNAVSNLDNAGSFYWMLRTAVQSRPMTVAKLAELETTLVEDHVVESDGITHTVKTTVYTPYEPVDANSVITIEGWESDKVLALL